MDLSPPFGIDTVDAEDPSPVTPNYRQWDELCYPSDFDPNVTPWIPSPLPNNLPLEGFQDDECREPIETAYKMAHAVHQCQGEELESFESAQSTLDLLIDDGGSNSDASWSDETEVLYAQQSAHPSPPPTPSSFRVGGIEGWVKAELETEGGIQRRRK